MLMRFAIGFLKILKVILVDEPHYELKLYNYNTINDYNLKVDSKDVFKISNFSMGKTRDRK